MSEKAVAALDALLLFCYEKEEMNEIVQNGESLLLLLLLPVLSLPPSNIDLRVSPIFSAFLLRQTNAHNNLKEMQLVCF